MDNNLSVRQGARLDLTCKQGDSESVSATLYLSPQEGGDVLSVHANYINGVADLSLDETKTATLGVYDYQINEEFPTGPPLKYPDPNGCDGGDCEFPTITVCKALDEDES